MLALFKTPQGLSCGLGQTQTRSLELPSCHGSVHKGSQRTP